MALGVKFVCTWLTISSCYGSISLTLVLVVTDGGSSTLCHSCGFDDHQTVPEMFPDPAYILSKDGVGWLWHLMINLYVFGSPFHLATAQSF